MFLYYVVTAIGASLTLWAQARVKSTFNSYSRVSVQAGLTGAEAAAAVCRAGNATGVRIERHRGFLTDHYDPRTKTLRLSPEVYDGRSISSVAVAAHEAGHSIQDVTSYAWLGLRSQMVNVTSIGSRMWMLPFFLGAILVASPLGQPLMMLGVLLFACVVFFQLITLPVEIDASRRAKVVLAQTGIVQSQEEAMGVSKVLDAAALTYVAAAASSLLTLFYLISRARR